MSELIETQITNLFEGIKKVVEENRAKAPLQPGKMSLLSMFRHSYENSHSDVLAYLLNPNAEHKHRDEYLRLFLQQVGFTHLLDLDLSKTKVYRESGRIDVYLEHPEFSIIIENKIYAWDQEEQLKRYNELVTKGWGVSQKKVYILYLTLSGYAPSEYSTAGDKDLQELVEDGRMLYISYRSEILYWLKQLSFKSNEHTLRSAIEQYIYTVEILTNQTEKEMSQTNKFFEYISSQRLNLTLSELNNLQDAFEHHRRLVIFELWAKTFEQLKKLSLTKGHKVILTDYQKIYESPEAFKAAIFENPNKDLWVGIGIYIHTNFSLMVEAHNFDSHGYMGFMSHFSKEKKLSKEVLDFLPKVNWKVSSDRGWYTNNPHLWENSKQFGSLNSAEDENFIFNKIKSVYDSIKDFKEYLIDEK